MESTPKKVSLQDKGIIFIKLLSSSFFMLIALRLVLMTIIAITGVRPKQPYLNEYSNEELLFNALIKGPLIETIIIIGLLWFFTHFTSRKIAMIITAVLFGVMHLAPGVNWIVVIISASIGYLFVYYYNEAKFRRVNGYWLVVIIHSLDNALSIIPEIVQFFS